MSAAFPFEPSGFFVLRTPLLPFDQLEAWAAEPAADALRARLRAAMARPEIREALFLASPDLEARLDPWMAGGLRPEQAARVERSLLRYLVRMASRCTPFGLFAGCSLGAWAEPDRLELEDQRRARRHTRLDMGYLCALAAALDRPPRAGRERRYRPNSSLYQAAGQLRYLEGRPDGPRGRAYHLVAVARTPWLDAALLDARDGAPADALAASLAGAGAAPEAARAFIQELIRDQILVSDLAPAITGADPLHGLLARLGGAAATRPVVRRLETVQEALRAMDQAGPGQAPARYRELARGLPALPSEYPLSRLFQVDLFRPAGARLGRAVRTAVTEAAELLWRITPARDPMRAFRTAFAARCGERWVDLAQALDEDLGIGFGAPAADAAPLLEGLAWPRTAPDPALDPRSAFLLNRLMELGPGAEWELTPDDVRALEQPEPGRPPDAFACTATLAAAQASDLARGDFRLLMEGFSGPSGVRLLGRFCHGDPDLEAQVREHLRREEAFRPDALFAEIVHLPEDRLGNILARPRLRRLEIPFLGAGDAPGADQIAIGDLQVAVRGRRVVLRSRSRDREVLPRLSAAHAYGRGLGLYRFLGALQDQDACGGFAWGPLDGLPFLPRVRRGRHVLRRARWRVRQEELQACAEAGPGEAFRAFGHWRAGRGLPRWVQLTDGDHALLVDLEHPMWVDALLRLVARRSRFLLQEFFPGPGELVVRGPGGRFCHELVLPFLRSAPAPAAIPVQAPASPAPRSFPPGSEWLSLRLLAGPSGADHFLRQVLPPFLARGAGGFDRWFFLRHGDPAPHLRLRFHGEAGALCRDLLPALHRLLVPLMEAGWLWKFEVDTYEPELERYGGVAGMAPAEELFWHDSRAVLDLVRAYPGDDGAPWRWRLGLAAVDLLLDDLGFDLEGKAGILHQARTALRQEFQPSLELERQLGAKFRPLRRELEALLAGTAQDPRAEPGLAILAARSRALRGCMATLRAAEAGGALQRPCAELATSFTHLHLNRLLRASQRVQEFVIYDFLGRLHDSRMATRRLAR